MTAGQPDEHAFRADEADVPGTALVPRASHPPAVDGRNGHEHLLERAALLDQIRLHIRELQSGPDPEAGDTTGGLLMVEGQAGLGKTSILERVRGIATEHRITVLRAKGAVRQQERPWDTVRQLFFRLLDACGPAELRALLGNWHGVVAPAVGLQPEDGAAKPDPLGVQDGLEHLVHMLTRKLGPLVLQVDDAHWSDRDSLRWLEAFARRTDEYPVLIVVARRPEEATPVLDLLNHLSQLPDTHRLDVLELTVDGTARLVRRQLGNHADDVFCLACHQVCKGGEPFLLHQVLSEVGKRGLEPVSANRHLLADIAAASAGPGVARRLSSLGPAAEAAARAVAVFGADAQQGRITALAGLTKEETVQATDLLRQCAILADHDDLDFIHPTVATAVYDLIPRSQRSEMHGQAAHLLVEDGRDPRAAAVHLLATEPGNDPWVVEQLRNAARLEQRAGSPTAAVRYLERALNEPPAAADRASIRFELGSAVFTFSPPDSVEHLEQALLADEAHRVLREPIVLQLSKSLGFSGRVKDAVKLLDEEASATNSVRSRLRLQTELFMWAAFWVDDDDPHQRARRLRKLASRLTGQDRTERGLLALRAWSGAQRGDPYSTVLDSANRAYGDGMSWVDEEWGFEIPLLLALTYMYCDQPEQAERHLRDGINELAAHGWQGTHLAYCHTFLGMIYHRLGRLQEAESEIRLGLRLALRLGEQAPAPWYSIGALIQVLIARGQTDEAARLAQEHQFHAPFPEAVIFPVPEAVLGELLLAEYETDAAVEWLTRVGDHLTRQGQTNPSWCAWRPNLALALQHRNIVEARKVAAATVKEAYRFGTPSALGQALRTAAIVAPEHEQLALLEESIMWLEPSVFRYEYAQSMVEYGAALRRIHGNRDAREALVKGLQAARACDAGGLADRARRELLAAGGNPLTIPRVGQWDRIATLTPRELEAARLSAWGMSNREVAERMGVKLSTAQKYLTIAFEKLDTGREGLRAVLGVDGGEEIPPEEDEDG